MLEPILARQSVYWLALQAYCCYSITYRVESHNTSSYFVCTHERHTVPFLNILCTIIHLVIVRLEVSDPIAILVVAVRSVGAPNNDKVNALFSPPLNGRPGSYYQYFIEINSSVCDAVFAIGLGVFRV